MEAKKNTGQDDRKKVAALAVGCVVIVGVLYLEWTNASGPKEAGGATRPRTSESAAPTPAPATASAARPVGVAKNAAADDSLATYDPEVNVAGLQEFEARPAPQFDRSPIDFGLTPQQQQAQKQEEQRREDAAKNPPAPPPPPPPPPITLKALGYEEAQGGARLAFITDCLDPTNCSSSDKEVDMYSVRAGESFANRYKVLEITPTSVEVEDESGHQKAQLPFPQ